MVSLVNVSKQYSNGRGVFDLSFEIENGIVGFLGKNGSGKTTTINLIMGFLKPDNGSILFNNKDIWKFDNMYKVKKDIGYLPNDDYLYDKLTGRENLEYIGILRNKNKKEYEKYSDYMKDLEINSFIDEPFHTYSTGMKRKIQLLCSFIGDPSILLYDEPHNGLDIIANNTLEKILLDMKEKGKLIFLSSHIIEIVQKITDEVIIIDEGKISGRIQSPYGNNLMEKYLDLVSLKH